MGVQTYKAMSTLWQLRMRRSQETCLGLSIRIHGPTWRTRTHVYQDMQVYATLSRYRPTSDSISAVLSSRKDVDPCMIARFPSYGLMMATKGSTNRHPHDTAHSVCLLSVAPSPSKDGVQGAQGILWERATMGYHQYQHSLPGRRTHSCSHDKGRALARRGSTAMASCYYPNCRPWTRLPGGRAQALGSRGRVRTTEAGAKGPRLGEGSCPVQDCTTRPAHAQREKTSRDDTSFCSDELTQIPLRKAAPHIHIPRIGHRDMQTSRRAGSSEGCSHFPSALRTALIPCILRALSKDTGKWARFHCVLSG
ncbi:hypothetical protein V8C26DRAFT_202601 [Trichoderma gracile]